NNIYKYIDIFILLIVQSPHFSYCQTVKLSKVVLKKLTFTPELVAPFPKKVDSFPKIVDIHKL
ncbi:MAG: hypothetical protein IKZ62_07975, partial [Prevotella sp.]|nr:hypothetical protein [Prevotella sp.]